MVHLGDGLLSQVAVMQLARLLVLLPAVCKYLVVENVDVLMKSVTNLFHFIDNLLFLGGCQLVLSNVSVADQVVIVQSVVSVSVGLLLGNQDSSRMLLSVHLALQTRDKKENMSY